MANILVVIDKTEFKYFETNDLVTNFWIIKTLIDTFHHDVFVTTINQLGLENRKAFAKVYKVNISKENIFYEKNKFENKIIDQFFHLVLFRPDPPVDIDYINATYIFDFVDRRKVKLVNDPKSIRNFNEKLHITLFPNFIPENIVSCSFGDIVDFVNINKKCVIKPLNQCFGNGVFFLNKDDKNLNTIIKSATKNGQQLVMVQKFIETLDNNQRKDKRVLILGSDVLDQAVYKVSNKNDFKFSTHNDNFIQKATLSTYEYDILNTVAHKLNSINLPLVGIDMIDSKIIEINVTSPCYFIREINNLFFTNLHYTICEYLQSCLDKILNSQLTSLA